MVGSLALAFVLFLTPAAVAAPEGRDEIREGLVFDSASGLALDLYLPAGREAPAPLVVVIGEPIEAPAPGRREEGLRAICAELADGGAAAALCDWRRVQGGGAGDLQAALSFLRARAPDERFDATRLGLHARGSGAQPALDVTMEEGEFGVALSLQSGMGVVIEGLRADLPILLGVDGTETTRTLAGMREFALQAEMCGAPLTWRTRSGAEPDLGVARFHLDRLLPLPTDPGTVEELPRAYAIATVHAERGDADGFFEWLARCEEIDSGHGMKTDVERFVRDGALVKLRATPRFREWVGAKQVRSRARLCRDFEPGRRIALRGQLFERNGTTPVQGARVYAYQTDRSGLYGYGDAGDAEPRLYGYVRTDVGGRFEIDTIQPGGYPKTMIPAHIHVVVQRADGRESALEFVFDDDPRLVDSGREYAERLGWPIVTLREEEGQTVGDARIVLR